jgi:O-antigen ligase
MATSTPQETPYLPRWGGLAGIGAIVLGGLLVWAARHFGLVQSVGVIMIIACTILALTHSELGLYVLVFAGATDGFVKNLHASYATMLIKDYFVALCLLRWAGPVALHRVPRSLRSPPVPWIAIFMLYTLTSIFNQNTPDVLTALAGLRTWIVWIPVYFIAFDVLRDRPRTRNFLAFHVWVLVGVAAFAIWQARVGTKSMADWGSGFAYLAGRQGYLTGSGGEQRVYGTTVSAGALGGAMVIAVMLALPLLIGTRSIWGKLLYGLGIAVCLAAMFFSGTRAAVVGLVFSLAVFLFFTRRVRLLLPLALVTVIALTYVAAQTEGRLYERLQSIDSSYMLARASAPLQRAWNLVLEHPFGVGTASGVGVGRMGVDVLHRELESTGVYVESDLGRALAELGLPGAFLFLAMLLMVSRDGWRAVVSCTDPEWRAVLASLLALIFSLFISMLVGAAYYGGGFQLWVFAAVLVRAHLQPEAEVVGVRRSRHRAQQESPTDTRGPTVRRPRPLPGAAEQPAPAAVLAVGGEDGALEVRSEPEVRDQPAVHDEASELARSEEAEAPAPVAPPLSPLDRESMGRAYRPAAGAETAERGPRPAAPRVIPRSPRAKGRGVGKSGDRE